ncbi:hypothetical protein [Cellulomonas sp. B6]|uniref:hypothetical protein n=1 Tax=Cellulomonas sp. B6 TaxID=1295626 RepID=UPI00073C82AD|nr:hypothetical protein [Cellulomonas sp. B6]KSW29624.1 hypothetical protein ATM99_07095 [Cellulomonas sp. B6]
MSGRGDLWRTAQDEAERLGDAWEVPVERVRARVRRHRARRTATTGAVALAAVGAVAVGLPPLLGAAGRTDVGASADWPAQFALCGQPLADVVAPPGRVQQTLVQSRDVTGADGTWLGTTSTRVDGAVSVADAPVDVEVVLVRDGVVVGIAPEDGEQGRVVVDLEEDVATSAGPGTAEWAYGTRLVSCDQYPDGAGRSEVPAGEYEVVMTQTVTWTEPEGGSGTGRATVTAPLRVTDEPSDPQDSPEVCGARTSDLARTAGPQANPFQVTLDARVPATTAAGSTLRFTVTATNEGATAVAGTSGPPDVLLTRDGRVVAATTAHEDVALDVDLEPGASRATDAGIELVACEALGTADVAGTSRGEPLTPGDYEVWVTTDLVLTTPTARDGGPTREHLVYGPWPLRVG